MSCANSLAVLYRRVRFFSNAFITIQSRSPWTALRSRSAVQPRCCAMPVRVSPRVLSFVDGFAGDTLDQVTIEVNSVVVHNSGLGLGITPGNSYTATFSLAVTSGDQVEVKVKKLGVNGAASFISYVGVR